MRSSEFGDEYLHEMEEGESPSSAQPIGVTSGSIYKELIREVPPRAAVWVAPETPAAEAIHAMIVRRIGCVLVVEAERMVGIFTERDVLLRVLESGRDPRTTPVSEFMTPSPEALKETDEVAYALNKMSVGGFRHIPILDADGKARFVLSVKDVVNWLVELAPSGVLNLPSDPSLAIPKRESGG